MAPKQEDDWSDSEDEDLGSDVETSVQLGIPDGPIESSSDILDAAVSRIGGHPVRYILHHMCTMQFVEYIPLRCAIGLSDFAGATVRIRVV